MFAILGIVDSRSPGDLAGLVIGGSSSRSSWSIGPITGASLNPARAFGPDLVLGDRRRHTDWAQFVPVYLLPGLAGPAWRRSSTTFWQARGCVGQRPIRSR